MANNININTSGGVPGTAQRNGSAQTAGTDSKAAGAVPAAGSDRVSVTPQASRLLAIEEQLMDVPEVNASKVAELRQAIADGTFEINPERIADKLLTFERRN